MVNLLLQLASCLSFTWVIDQITKGNAYPFFIWTLIVSVSCFFIGRVRGGWVPKFLIVSGLDAETARAALDSLNAEGMLPVSLHCDTVLADAATGKGMFAFNELDPSYIGSGSKYRLKRPWRRYLQKPRKRKKLESIAGK